MGQPVAARERGGSGLLSYGRDHGVQQVLLPTYLRYLSTLVSTLSL